MKASKLSFILGLLVLLACDKDQEATGTDLELLNMAKSIDGFVWYKNTDVLLPKSNLSGHSESFLRTRFNAVAATKLDANGKVQSGINFPDGSLLIKELYSNSTSLSKYAILYKKPDHKYADSNGWVWGYLNKDGTVAEPASNKGSACKSCHSQGGNIDYSLMNVAFP